MPAIRAIVADDEELARTRLRELLAEVPDVALVAECANGREAIDAVRRFAPELLFLDVQMPESDGFDVLRELGPEERPRGIIFVTAYDRYALGAFEVNAADYLLKPYTRERFADALARARARLGDESGAGRQRIEALLEAIAARRSAGAERLGVKSKDGVQFVRVDEIDWLQAEGNYTRLYLGKDVLRMRETISDLETRLEPFGFVRVHRSIVVNTDRISRLEPWANGEYLIVLRNGAKINTGRGYGDVVRRLFA